MSEVIKLDKSMIKRAKDLIEKVDPKLVPIENVDKVMASIPYTGIVDIFNADVIIAKCNELIDSARDYASVCKAFTLEARRRKKAETAKAILKRSREWATNESINCTDVVKKAYPDMDEGVMKWTDLENAWSAMESYFENLREDMRDRYYWFKRVFEYQKAMSSAGTKYDSGGDLSKLD